VPPLPGQRLVRTNGRAPVAAAAIPGSARQDDEDVDATSQEVRGG
jgi:hypothetical protein